MMMVVVVQVYLIFVPRLVSVLSGVVVVVVRFGDKLLLVVLGIFVGKVGHGMIVLYKGKGSPAIERTADSDGSRGGSGRRRVRDVNREHWGLMMMLLLLLLLLLR